MPMLTTLRMRFPVWPGQRPSRTASANAAMRSSTRVHLGDDVDAVDHEALALRRAQRDVQHRALLGDVDVVAAEHRRDARRAGRTRGELERAAAASRR